MVSLFLLAGLLGASGSPELLVFASNADGDFDLYVCTPDGAGARKLADLPGDETWPRWSPTGTEVLFV